jgi:hypothetical protein
MDEYESLSHSKWDCKYLGPCFSSKNREAGADSAGGRHRTSVGRRKSMKSLRFLSGRGSAGHGGIEAIPAL